MTEEQSRVMVLSLALVCGIGIQAAAMFAHPFNTWLDWAVLALLALSFFAHVDGYRTPDGK